MKKSKNAGDCCFQWTQFICTLLAAVAIGVFPVVQNVLADRIASAMRENDMNISIANRQQDLAKAVANREKDMQITNINRVKDEYLASEAEKTSILDAYQRQLTQFILESGTLMFICFVMSI